MDHTVLGYAAKASLIGPTDTALMGIKPYRTKTSLHVFTDERSKHCTMTLPEAPMYSTKTSMPNKISQKQRDNIRTNNEMHGLVRRGPSPILEDAPSFRASRQVTNQGIILVKAENNAGVIREINKDERERDQNNAIEIRAETENLDTQSVTTQDDTAIPNVQDGSKAHRVIESNSVLSQKSNVKEHSIVPNSATPLVISREVEQSLNEKLHTTQTKIISPIPTLTAHTDEGRSVSGDQSGRTSLNDVTLAHFLDGQDGPIVPSPQMTSSPILNNATNVKPVTKEEPVLNMYKPVTKESSPETDKLYDVDLL